MLRRLERHIFSPSRRNVQSQTRHRIGALFSGGLLQLFVAEVYRLLLLFLRSASQGGCFLLRICLVSIRPSCYVFFLLRVEVMLDRLFASSLKVLLPRPASLLHRVVRRNACVPFIQRAQH